MRRLWAVLLLNAATVLAAPVPPTKAALSADVHLRTWFHADAKAQEKIARAQALTFVEPDLKDAVADGRASAPKPRRRPDCKSLQDCAVPPLAVDVPAGEAVEPAVLAMMRPWIWLAEGKGVRLGVAHAAAESPALLNMNIQGLGLSSVGLNIKRRAEGGVHLWFSRGGELAGVYARARNELQGAPALGR